MVFLRFLLLIGIVFLFNGCLADIKPIRYNGVYKKFSDSNVVYTKFDKQKKQCYSITYPNEDDKKAIHELEKISKTNTKNQDFFINGEKKIHIYSSINNLSSSGEIKKNAKGEVENSYFIEAKNHLPYKSIDLRVIKHYRLFLSNANVLTKESFNDVVGIFKDRYIVVKKDNKYGVFDAKTKRLKVAIKYQWIDTKSSLNAKFIPFKIGNKYGFFDQNFSTILPPKWDDIHHYTKQITYFGNNGYFVDHIQPVKVGKKWRIIDEKGRYITRKSFNGIGEYISKKFVPILQKNGIYKFTDLTTGKYYSTQTYQNHTNNGYNILDIGGNKEIIVDKYGKQALKYMARSIFVYKDKSEYVYFVASFKKDEDIRYVLFDANSKQIIKSDFKEISPLYDEKGDIVYFTVSDGYNSVGLYNTKGDMLIPQLSSNITFFNTKKRYLLVRFSENGKSTYTNRYIIFKQGAKKPLLESSTIYQRGANSYALFYKDGLYGIIDANLNVVVKPKFEKSINIYKDVFVSYDDGDSCIYKITSKSEPLCIDARINLDKNYIIADGDVYDYNLNRLNQKHLTNIYINEKFLSGKNSDGKWVVIYNGKRATIDGKFDNITSVGNIAVAKVSDK